jgi:hypothetical protein
MMDYPTKESAEIVAGDTVSWVKNLPDYPPYLWTLTYSIKAPPISRTSQIHL